MEKNTTKKRGFGAIYRLCPLAHLVALISGGLILLHLLTRQNHDLMVRLSEGFVRPLHRALASACSHLSFSAAELIICVFAINILVYIIFSIIRIFRRDNKLKQVYIIFMNLLSTALLVYALFCLLWGVYYYGDDFETASGLEAGEVSTEQLETVTAYFAALTNEYAGMVERDGEGVYSADRLAILARSSQVYENIQRQFPCLEGPAVDVKPFFFSRLMSYTDFTGFFFPFTAEANVNMDFPPGLFASTVGHELAHQRGVAKEQEANFVSVLACLSYGDVDYCYSAAMLAYTHLGNALHSADYDAWLEIYSSLSEPVLLDFAASREYWAKFDTPVQKVTNTVYENFLYSYDQDLGLKSYGACVDLLVNYYYEQAVEYLSAG